MKLNLRFVIMINPINTVNCNPIKKVAFKQNPQPIKENIQKTIENDKFVSSTQQENLPPDIGTFRLTTGFLTDKQVDDINKTRQLPPNAKFVMNGYGSYAISNNFFGIRVGTQTLPEGFEVRKNVFGQAVVLPKGSEGLLIK